MASPKMKLNWRMLSTSRDWWKTQLGVNTESHSNGRSAWVNSRPQEFHCNLAIREKGRGGSLAQWDNTYLRAPSEVLGVPWQ